MIPKLWLPDSGASKKEDQVTMKCRVEDARYLEEEGCLVVRLRLRDGSMRQAVLKAADFSYHGRAYASLRPEEVSFEMNKTAVMFKKSGEQGRDIDIRMFKHQAELQERP